MPAETARHKFRGAASGRKPFCRDCFCESSPRASRIFLEGLGVGVEFAKCRAVLVLGVAPAFCTRPTKGWFAYRRGKIAGIWNAFLILAGLWEPAAGRVWLQQWPESVGPGFRGRQRSPASKCRRAGRRERSRFRAWGIGSRWRFRREDGCRPKRDNAPEEAGSCLACGVP